ncbi:MAG: translation initiation factor [Chloroflexi bacterium AL-N5]|nr:translation initiation factor [Chloroflexi bacterium AL-N5]
MKRSQQKSATDRAVYSEFSSPQAKATSRPDDPPIAEQKLTVQASRKGRKGKTVTVVSGFQTSAEKLTELAKQLKSQCGSGGTLKDQSIEIQGDHSQKLAEVLKKLGYPVKISGG